MALSVDEARLRILGGLNPTDAIRVQLHDAIGRALAAPVRVTRTLPPWDNSQMDGYAVRAADGARALEITQTLFAGDAPAREVGSGTCARIMTGARLPPGADAVVMQEKTRRIDDAHVEVLEAATEGQFIRRRGEDVREGEPLFAAGRELSAADLGALWAQGLTEVSVHRAPRVSIVTGGDELLPVGASSTDAIIDTNGPVLQVLARAAGAEAMHLGRASDTLESLRAHFERGLDADVLITVAGASVGERDFTRDALRSLGVELDFWKLAMRPGKPLLFGRRGRTLVFGLPGNPVSAMVTFELFVRPALRALQGLPTTLETLPARAAAPMKPAPGLRLFTRATYEHRDGALWATPVGSQSSGALSSAFAAHALVDLAPDSPPVAKGDAITVIPLRWTNR